jgi:histidinol-phosphate aminotransferase
MDFEKMVRPFLEDIRPYKPGRPLEEVRRENETITEFIKLASNENPRPPHEFVQRAIIDMLSQINRYPESGCYDLVMEIAKTHSVEPNEVFVGNGSNEIIDLLVRAFLFPGENVVFPWPSFVIYKLVPKICDIKGISVPCSQHRIDLEAMLNSVNNKTKMVFICNPNNPTSTYVGIDELSSFLESLPDNILVIMDEAYYEYVSASDFPQTIEMQAKKNCLITLRTFSKVHSLAGLRIGYAIAHRKVVEILHKVRQPFNVNRLAQTAAIAALKCKDKNLPAIKETLREREILREAILEVGWECPPSQTNFLYVIPRNFPGDVCEPLLRRGVIIRDMTPFGAEKSTFRLTVGLPEENRKFLEALDSILAAQS